MCACCLRGRCDIHPPSTEGADRASAEWRRAGEGNKERDSTGSPRGGNGSGVCPRPGRDGGMWEETGGQPLRAYGLQGLSSIFQGLLMAW